MEKLADRLKQCRLNKKNTQKEMAIMLNISERAYQHYELNDREPPLSKLVILADYFDVSIDYLVGRTDTLEFNKSFPK